MPEYEQLDDGTIIIYAEGETYTAKADRMMRPIELEMYVRFYMIMKEKENAINNEQTGDTTCDGGTGSSAE